MVTSFQYFQQKYVPEMKQSGTKDHLPSTVLKINCTKDNGYLCFPNEKFTQLLEFCHTARFIWVQEGTHDLHQSNKAAKF